MKKDKKRVKRKEFSKKLDITKAITLEQLGTKDDPCFGKYHSSKEEECKRCGDSEFCAIAMGQLTHIKRAELEKSGNFKDLEEKDIKKVPKPIWKKELRLKVKEVIKDNKAGITFDNLVLEMFAMFSKDGVTKKRLRKLVLLIINKCTNIYKTKNVYKWK